MSLLYYLQIPGSPERCPGERIILGGQENESSVRMEIRFAKCLIDVGSMGWLGNLQYGKKDERCTSSYKRDLCKIQNSVRRPR